MNRNYRNMSLTRFLVLVILLCSIVCSVTNVFGRVAPAQEARIIKKEGASAQITAQLAEKVESESDSKHSTPLFVIQTVIQLFQFDSLAPRFAGLVFAARFGNHRNAVPLYLAERTIRI